MEMLSCLMDKIERKTRKKNCNKSVILFITEMRGVMVNLDKSDKIMEWRKKHPRCSCCKHSRVIPMDSSVRCAAKGCDIWLANKPRRCELYEPVVGDA